MAGQLTAAGRLSQRLLIERQTRAPDGGGGWSVNWTPVAEIWAEVWPVSAAERAKGGGLAGEAAVTLMRARIRAGAHVAADMRAV